jgi:hypothetical protein
MGDPIVSIELLLDPALETAVRAEWEALAATGLSSMAAYTAESNRPHITMLVRPTLALADVAPLLARSAPEVTLGAPVLFGDGERRVLARSVVVSWALLGLHADLHAGAGAGDDAPHTAPGSWTPHVTLARRVRLTDLPAALPLVAGELRGRAVSLRRWDAASRVVTPLGDFDSPAG